MYSLHLSTEQLEIRDTVRDFVARELKPVALAADRLEARERPLLLDQLDQASQLGLRALALSESAGGAGADNLTCCIVVEELAAGDPDVAAVLAQTWTLAHVLFDGSMTQAQRERFLPEFLADPRYHLAHAREEPDDDAALGIHYHRARGPEPSRKTTAVHSGGSWILNGTKHRVVNVPLAKLFAVEVATTALGAGKDAGKDAGKGASTILVPRDTPGLSVEIDDPGMHRQHGACGRVLLWDCRVPAENLLGSEGQRALSAQIGLRGAQDLALNLGIGRAAYEAALDYAQLRVQGGRRIIEHQAIGAKLAEIAARLQVARTAIWQAAWACDHPAAFADRSLPDLPLARIARLYASQAIYHATKDAAECFGAMGVMRDMPLQKCVHDALICLHSGETDSEAKLHIAEAIAGYRRAPAELAAE
jgi:alkylation response protein AidB-like acyl-CoA dehydrogenase